jgi:hypothetical protein
MTRPDRSRRGQPSAGGGARAARGPCAVLPCLLLAAALAAAPAPAVAARPAAPTGARTVQPPPDPDAALAPGQELDVYLMTMGPGDAVWEMFGHNAIWIVDRARGTSVAYNYGMFSFDQPGFIGNFLKGRMQYWMAPVDGEHTVESYRRDNRSVWAQRLDLTPAERLALRDFLEWNALPANAFYTYDYYRDNCSTRVRDALDLALDGLLRRTLEPMPTDVTYRSESLRLTAGDLAIYTGLILGLGPTADRPIDAWEHGFIPMALREYVRGVRVPGPDGALRPLVAEELTLFEAVRAPTPAAPPRRLPYYIAIGLLIGAVMAGLGRLGPAGGPAAAGLAFMALFWGVIIGGFGTLLAGLWAFTDHTVAWRNENLFHVNPLALALAVTVPLLALRRGRSPTGAFGLAALLAALSLLGLLLRALPVLGQQNLEIIALVLPGHLALAWSLRRWPAPRSAPTVHSAHPEWRARAARASGRHR